MPLTLASLVQHTGLRLTVRAGESRLDTAVRWAHASELADPVPYMEGGELLLITALKLDAEDPEAMRRYVRRLTGARVAGLGFAVGVHYADIPDALLRAAEEADMPLLAVPRRTPFLAISKAVSAALAAEQYRAVTAGFAAQRELTRQVLAGGPEALLSALAGQVGGWAALYDPSGELTGVAPDWAARRAAEVTGEVERLRGRPVPASAVVAEVEDRTEVHTFGSGRGPVAALAVGTEGALGTVERYAVHAAISLLTLAGERSGPLEEAERRLAAAVLRMLLAGEPDHARAVAGDLYGALLDAPLRMVLAEATGPVRATGTVPRTGAGARTVDAGQGARTGAAGAAGARETGRAGEGPRGAKSSGVAGSATGSGRTPAEDSPRTAMAPALGLLAEAVESAARRAGESLIAVPEGGRLVLLVVDGGAAAEACVAYARRAEHGARADGSRARGEAAEHELADTSDSGQDAAGAGLVVGLSAPAGPIAASAAYRQAEQALSVARRRGRALVEHEQMTAGSVVPLLADDAVRAFADGMLRPLHEHDASGRGDLVASLRAWLARHGQWDAAAADLGVHRHTLRYRMRRVEEILGRSLDDPDARMELWLALKATGAGE